MDYDIPKSVETRLSTFLEKVHDTVASKVTAGEIDNLRTLAYFLLQRKDFSVDNSGRWKSTEVKVGNYDNEMTIESLAARMWSDCDTGTFRWVFYGFGGSSQAKGFNPIRSPAIEWFDRRDGTMDNPPLVGALTDGDAQNPFRMQAAGTVSHHGTPGGMVGQPNPFNGFGADLTGMHSLTLAREQLSLQRREAKEREDRLMDMAEKRMEAHTKDMREAMSDQKKFMSEVLEMSLRMMDKADDRYNESHSMKVGAMRAETRAVVRERRAALDKMAAEEAWDQAEAALESGESSGWLGMLETLGETEEGKAIIVGTIDRILGTFEKAVNGGSDGDSRGSGGGGGGSGYSAQDVAIRVGAALQGVDLTDEQRAKFTESVRKAFNS